MIANTTNRQPISTIASSIDPRAMPSTQVSAMAKNVVAITQQDDQDEDAEQRIEEGGQVVDQAEAEAIHA